MQSHVKAFPLFGAEKLYVQLISTSIAGALHVVGSPNDQQDYVK